MMLARIEISITWIFFPIRSRRNVEGVLDRPVNVDRVVVELELSVGDARQVQKIVNEERFQLDVTLENFEIVTQIVR